MEIINLLNITNEKDSMFLLCFNGKAKIDLMPSFCFFYLKKIYFKKREGKFLVRDSAYGASELMEKLLKVFLFDYTKI